MTRTRTLSRTPSPQPRRLFAVFSALAGLTAAAFVLALSMAFSAHAAQGQSGRSAPNQSAPNPSAKTQEEAVILALGTSLTAGYNLPQPEGFTARLEAALEAEGYPVRIINAGVSGDTSAGGRARLDWLMSGEITHAIVELGSNDALRGLDPAQTEANLDAILTRLKQEDIEILLTGMLAPPNLGDEYEAEFNAIYPRLAEKHDVLFYPFFLDGVAAEPELNQPDGIHPNAEGTKVIVERILPYVKRLLNGEDVG